MLTAIIAFSLSALLLAAAVRRVSRSKPRPTVDDLDAVLPQTQCTRCNYPGCRPYAEALLRGEADINQCPPGGEAGVRALAKLLGVPAKPLNPAHGPVQLEQTVAVIDEQTCIGCTLCILACPVDAILGATKQMHTVIAQECTGCELCVAPCPVDCIRMVPATPPAASAARPRLMWYRRAPSRLSEQAGLARRRHQARLQRLAREKQERAARWQRPKTNTAPPAAADTLPVPARPSQTEIRAAIERARLKRAGRENAVTRAPLRNDGQTRADH